VSSKLPGDAGKIINKNSMDLVAIENYGWSSVTLLGGISVKGEADRITGSFLGYKNNQSNTTDDVNIREASNSALGIFQTNPLPQVVGETYVAQPSLISCPAQGVPVNGSKRRLSVIRSIICAPAHFSSELL
jgi:hypothetical protein